MLSSLSHALMIMSRWPEVSAEKTHIWEEQECSSTFLMRTLPHPAQTDPPLKSTSSSAIYSATSNTKRAFHNLLHLLPQQRPSVFSGLDFTLYSPSALDTLEEKNSHCIFLPCMWVAVARCWNLPWVTSLPGVLTELLNSINREFSGSQKTAKR